MKTEIIEKKGFDAVKYMRNERKRISQEIEGMTAEQEIEYFKKQSALLKKRK